MNNNKTIIFHVDDIMSSHVDKKINDEFLVWLNKKYGEHEEVKEMEGKKYEYLDMDMEFINGKVKISTIQYIKDILEEFPVKFKEKQKTTSPAVNDMFSEDTHKKLNHTDREMFHIMVAKALFIGHRERLDIKPIVSVLCTRVKQSGRENWNKLVREMKFYIQR